MKPFFAKCLFIVIIVFAVIGAGLFFFIHNEVQKISPPVIETKKITIEHSIIGKSVQGRSIEAYTYGNGATHIAFVGGIHGGYEWNSVLLAYKLIDYLNINFRSLPTNLTVTVIPSANPDGVFKVIGKEGRFEITDIPTGTDESIGRFNADKVDLNRNFACNWQATSTWKGNIVSAGTSVFSEPEARTIRDFVLKVKPKAMIFFHSQSNAVYASQCGMGILQGTRDIMNTYAKSASYPAVDVFDSYAVTGAVEDWLASINIPAITVELKTHNTVEWEKNLLGIKALFNYFGSK